MYIERRFYIKNNIIFVKSRFIVSFNNWFSPVIVFITSQIHVLYL